MADLRTNFAGIRSPNPFLLASAPPSNSGAQIHRAFEAGWGGAVWKTIGAPVLNVSNRYGTWRYGNEKMLAINNVELISDRPREENFREIAGNFGDKTGLGGSRGDRFRDGGIQAGSVARRYSPYSGHRR